MESTLKSLILGFSFSNVNEVYLYILAALVSLTYVSKGS